MLSAVAPPVELVVTAEVHADSPLLSPVPACLNRALMELSVDRFPFMESHRVKNEPVLPVVLVVEWFARALRQRYPHLQLIGLHDLKVLRGVSLTDADAVRMLSVVFADSHQNGSLTLQVELHGANDVVHYRCRAELATSTNAAVSTRKASNGAADRDWPWTVNQAYEQLFHGPDFQVLRTLDVVSETSARATMVGIHSMGWSGGPWSTDPAALDGGLQLALLWGIERTGRMSLPSAIRSTQFHRSTQDVPLIHCEIITRSVGPLQHTFDIHLTTPGGEPLVDLLEVDMTLLQTGSAS
jgi:hypothetical protein